MNYIPLSLQGVPVTILDPVIATSNVKRTWKERLFTLPLTPFTATKKVKSLVDVLEDGKIYKTPQGLAMNSKTFNDCEKALFTKATGVRSNG